MQIVINLQREQLTFFLIAVLIVLGTSIAIAYQSGSPSTMGHTWDEIECSGCITSANLEDGTIAGTDVDESTLDCEAITGGAGLCDGTDDGLPGVYACIRETSSTTCNDICQARGLTCTHSLVYYVDQIGFNPPGNTWIAYCTPRCQRSQEISPGESSLCKCE